MMRKRFYVPAMLLATVLSGCGKEYSGPGESGIGNLINISAGIEPMVKSPQLDGEGKGYFSEGDEFTLLISDGTASCSVRFDYRVGSTQLFWKDVGISPSDGKVDFSACYPVQALSDGIFVFDLTEADCRDLLLSRTTDIETGSESSVMMSFRHAMHKLLLNYTVVGDPGISDEEILTSCSAISSCSVDLVSGKISSDPASRYSFTDAGKSVEFLIVPQAASEVSVEVKAGDIVRTFRLDELDQEIGCLEGGHQLTVDMIVKDGKIIFGDSVIEGWGDQGTVGGEIIL